jgi:hypothetical protein
MRLSEIGPSPLKQSLAGDGLHLGIGPFTVRLHSPLASLANGLGILYAEYPVERDAGGFADFHLTIGHPRGLRRWVRPQAIFQFDGGTPFQPVPRAHAIAVFEWGLNWVIANNAHQYLIIHAAVVERGGRALVLPGAPGAGKSTLCAALVSRGWRLLSDEMTMIDDERRLVPIPRPISLKNRSVDVIRAFAPDAVLGPPIVDTKKGDVVHVRAPTDSVLRSGETALPRWIVFPKYTPDAETSLTPESKGKAFMRLADQAFNYSVLGRHGFDVLGDVIDACDAFDLCYGDLEDAVRRISLLDA